MFVVDTLKTVGQIAGIGGLALGIFLLLFRDLIRIKIFPLLPADEAYRLLRLITAAVWSVTVLGICAWVYVVTLPPSSSRSERSNSAIVGTGVANTGTQTFNGPVSVKNGSN
jgi:hypothetical protein